MKIELTRQEVEEILRDYFEDKGIYGDEPITIVILEK